MNHKWDHTSKKNDKCKVCGCEREKHYTSDRSSFFIYTRSGIVSSNRIDCINWEVENSKTID